MRRNRFLVITIACLSMVACGDEETDDETRSTKAAIFHVKNLWRTRDINVCFDGGFIPQSGRGTLQAALRGQRSWASSADINFVGWQDCSPSSKGIRIQGAQLLDPPPVPASFVLGLGPDPAGVSKMTLRFDTADCSFLQSGDECAADVGLHEFGHSLGLAHEQLRPNGQCVAGVGELGDEVVGSYDGASIMEQCGAQPSELSQMDRVGIGYLYGARYGDTPHMADFDGDSTADLLCSGVVTGEKYLDLSGPPSVVDFRGTDYATASRRAWCTGMTEILFKGDFNGDGRADLLCHDASTGRFAIDIDVSSRTNGPDLGGGPFCHARDERILVGDFNGDGLDDLLCHDIEFGKHRILRAEAQAVNIFPPDDIPIGNRFCLKKLRERLHVGDFDADGIDDVLCHDLDTGLKEIRRGPYLAVASFVGGAGFCGRQDERLIIGDFDGNGRSDLMCRNAITRETSIDYGAGSQGILNGTNTEVFPAWCNKLGDRDFVGDFNGDGRDDLLCQNVWMDLNLTPTPGLVADDYRINFADSNGRFDGNEDKRFGRFWCKGNGQELH